MECCLSAEAAAHSCSHATFSEVPYRNVMGCQRTLAARLVCLGARDLCQLCGADYGDEMHLVFECHGLADLREQFASVFQERQTMQHVAARHVAGCQILRCRREEDAGN